MDPSEYLLFILIIGLQSLTLQQIFSFQHRLDGLEIRVQNIEMRVQNLEKLLFKSDKK